MADGKIIYGAIKALDSWREKSNRGSPGKGRDEYWPEAELEYPEGFAKFARSFIILNRVNSSDWDIELAGNWISWLLGHRSPQGMCWGLPFDHGDVGAGTPYLLTTSFCADSFIEFHRASPDSGYLEKARESIEWAQKLAVPGQKVHLYYSPKLKQYIPNASAMFLGTLSSYSEHDDAFKSWAGEIAAALLDCQNKNGSWYYNPGSDAMYSHHIDNLHTSYVLEGLWRYQRMSGDREILPALESGTKFLWEQFYKPSGYGRERYLHRFDERSDVGFRRAMLDTITRNANSLGLLKGRDPETRLWGYAAAIRAFVAASHNDSRYLSKAMAIAGYVVDKMQDPEGYFYYRSSHKECYIRHEAHIFEALAILIERIGDTG